jgi:hypothetical protein
MVNTNEYVTGKESAQNDRVDAEEQGEAVESRMKLASAYVNLTVTRHEFRRHPYFI